MAFMLQYLNKDGEEAVGEGKLSFDIFVHIYGTTFSYLPHYPQLIYRNALFLNTSLLSACLPH